MTATNVACHAVTFSRKQKTGRDTYDSSFVESSVTILVPVADESELERRQHLEAALAECEKLVNESVGGGTTAAPVTTPALPIGPIGGGTADVASDVRQAFPGWTVVSPAADQQAAQQSADAEFERAKAMSKPDQKAWVNARHASHPSEFFDNRADKASGKANAKAPDFKHKATGIGLWLS